MRGKRRKQLRQWGPTWAWFLRAPCVPECSAASIIVNMQSMVMSLTGAHSTRNTFITHIIPMIFTVSTTKAISQACHSSPSILWCEGQVMGTVDQGVDARTRRTLLDERLDRRLLLRGLAKRHLPDWGQLTLYRQACVVCGICVQGNGLRFLNRSDGQILF